MPRRSAVVPAVAAFLLVVGSVACTGGPDAPTPSPSQPGTAFTLAVEPTTFVGRAIPGARVVLLVTVGGAATDGPAAITAVAAGATVEVDPPQLSPGTVGEVTVIPGTVSEEVPLTVMCAYDADHPTGGDARYEHLSFEEQRQMAQSELARRGAPEYDVSAYAAMTGG